MTNKRRVGRLEAVALERPQIQLVVELILRIELGHEVLDRRRRLRGPVRRVMCTICRVREVRQAKGVDIGDIYETPKPAWWRQAYEYVGSFFRRAPAPKRKREDDDDDGPKKKVASDAQVTALLREVRQAVRQADENLSAPVEDDDDDVVDLTV